MESLCCLRGGWHRFMRNLKISGFLTFLCGAFLTPTSKRLEIMQMCEWWGWQGQTYIPQHKHQLCEMFLFYSGLLLHPQIWNTRSSSLTSLRISSCLMELAGTLWKTEHFKLINFLTSVMELLLSMQWLHLAYSFFFFLLRQLEVKG